MPEREGVLPYQPEASARAHPVPIPLRSINEDVFFSFDLGPCPHSLGAHDDGVGSQLEMFELFGLILLSARSVLSLGRQAAPLPDMICTHDEKVA